MSRIDFVNTVSMSVESPQILLDVIKESLSSINTPPILNIFGFLNLTNNAVFNTNDYTNVALLGFPTIFDTNKDYVLQTITEQNQTKIIENVNTHSNFLVVGDGLKLFKSDNNFVIKLGENITITKNDNEFIYRNSRIPYNYKPIRFGGSSIFQIEQRYYDTEEFGTLLVGYCMVYVSIVLHSPIDMD